MSYVVCSLFSRFFRPLSAGTAVLLLLFGGTGCVSRYPRAVERVREGRSAGIVLDGVPCIRQTKNQCGPAALEMVMGFWLESLDSEEIAARVFNEEAGTTSVQSMGGFLPPPGYWTSAGYFDGPGLINRLESGLPIIVLLERTRPNFFGGHYYVVHGVDRTRELLFLSSGAKCDQLMSWPYFEYLWERTGHWLMFVCPLNAGVENWELSAGEHVDRGWHFERNGMPAMAELDYFQALALDPGLVQARINAGNLLMSQERWSEAESLFREGLSLRPGQPQLLNNLAWVLGEEGSIQQGLEIADTLVQREGGWESAPVEYLDTLGWLLARAGNDDEALAVLRQALARARGESAAPDVIQGIEMHIRQVSDDAVISAE
jgi:hypothetical protein